MLATQRLFRNRVRGAAVVTALFWFGGAWDGPPAPREPVDPNYAAPVWNSKVVKEVAGRLYDTKYGELRVRE